MYREIDERMQWAMESVINSVPDLLDIKQHVEKRGLRIVCIQAEGQKKSGGKIVYADCRAVPEAIKPTSNADFIITFYEDATHMTVEQLHALIWHELKHIDSDAVFDGKYKVIPHDFEDFHVVVSTLGADWATDEDVPDITDPEFWRGGKS